MSQTPFDRTLFLDTDTQVLEPIDEVFELLEYFDIGINFRSQFLRSEPYFMPWCNSGVILYKSNNAVTKTFVDWLNRYDEAAEKSDLNNKVLDDRFLPIAIANGTARVVHLASALNFFAAEPQVSCSPIRIIHTRCSISTKAVVAENERWTENSDWQARIWVPQFRNYFPRGGLRFPGIWIRDPMVGLSFAVRKLLSSALLLLEKVFKG